jgi:hypothetical protein
MAYMKIKSGHWYWYARKGRAACCDCGLVHDEEYRLARHPTGGRVILCKMSRNNKATAAMRRRRGIKITKEANRAKR